MTNFTPSRNLQNLGAGDPRALGLKVLGAEAMVEFLRNQAFGQHQMRKGFNGAKEAQFPVIGRAVASYHVPGQEIDGQAIQSGERVIALEDLRIAPVFIANIDEVLSHFDSRQPYARAIGEILGRSYDQDVAREMVLGARSTSTIPGAAGHGDGTVLTNAGYANDGSVIFDGFFDLGVAMAEKDVPMDANSTKGFVRPVQYALMVQSDRPIDRDLSPDNGSLAEGIVRRVNGIPIVRTNNVPNADDTANTDIQAKRRADYSNVFGIIAHRDGVGTLDGMPVQIESEDSVRHQGTLLVGKYLSGSGLLRPEVLGVLQNA